MEKVNEINKVIAAYFALNTSLEIVPAKDLMPHFIKAGIFPKDNNNGLPIRTILRKLDAANKLYHIPSVIAERKDKNTNWFFGSNVQSNAAPFKQSKIIKPSKTKTEATSKRKDSDEHYIIDLCDELLGIKGSRQHRFSFLVGDSGIKLPVDVYYETLNLVIEFNEQQHTKSVKHFDKPDKLTVSGVHRGEQRKIYDKRKREVLPQHGIKIIDISYFDFTCDAKGKVKRNIENDLEIIQSKLRNLKWNNINTPN